MCILACRVEDSTFMALLQPQLVCMEIGCLRGPLGIVRLAVMRGRPVEGVACHTGIESRDTTTVTVLCVIHV